MKTEFGKLPIGARFARGADWFMKTRNPGPWASAVLIKGPNAPVPVEPSDDQSVRFAGTDQVVVAHRVTSTEAVAALERLNNPKGWVSRPGKKLKKSEVRSVKEERREQEGTEETEEEELESGGGEAAGPIELKKEDQSVLLKRIQTLMQMTKFGKVGVGERFGFFGSPWWFERCADEGKGNAFCVGRGRDAVAPAVKRFKYFEDSEAVKVVKGEGERKGEVGRVKEESSRKGAKGAKKNFKQEKTERTEKEREVESGYLTPSELRKLEARPPLPIAAVAMWFKVGEFLEVRIKGKLMELAPKDRDLACQVIDLVRSAGAEI